MRCRSRKVVERNLRIKEEGRVEGWDKKQPLATTLNVRNAKVDLYLMPVFYEYRLKKSYVFYFVFANDIIA